MDKILVEKNDVMRTHVWIGGQSVLGDKYGASHCTGIQNQGEFMIWKILRLGKYLPMKSTKLISTQKITLIKNQCRYVWRWIHTIGENMIIRFQKCKRKFIGRVLCEFPSLPRIHIKGLCKENTMDRDYQLMAPEPTQGNTSTTKVV